VALGMQVGHSPGHIVLDGDPAPLTKRGQGPPCLAHFYCGQTHGCVKMPLGMEVGLGPGEFVSDGDPTPSQKRGRSPQFSAQVYCGQTAAQIKMPLGKEVGLACLRDIVLHGGIAPLPLRGTAP